jgi:tetratricopeptide (TPR) repeat protein
MNKFALTFILFAITFSLKAQDSTSVGQNERPAIYWLYHNNYNLGLRYNDMAVAKSALYSLINIDPQNDSLKFTLAYMYFENKQYPSAILVCMDILARNPQHASSLEISAVSYEELGLKEKALTNYEQLYMVTDSIESLYKLTFIQYDLKRYGECEVNIDIIMNNPEIDNKTMVFQISETEQKEFSLRVAVLNLRGLVMKDQGDIEGARASFNGVLAIAPDFVFATNNLAELDK